MKFIKAALEVMLPYEIIKLYFKLKINKNVCSLIKKTREFYKTHSNDIFDDRTRINEINKILDIIEKKNDVISKIYYMMDESICLKYMRRKVKVLYDNEKSLKYIIVDGKKMYFKRSMSNNYIAIYYNMISMEQDYSSPHRYFSNDNYFFGVIPYEKKKNKIVNEKPFNVKKDDVVVDLGVAEGNFALSVVDVAKKLYLFESDIEWCEALQATFEPYKHKVEIINKSVSSTDGKNTISLDTFFKNKEEVNFIKYDIEDYTQEGLEGSESLIKKSKDIKLAVCTYHKPQDEKLFHDILSDWGFETFFTEGYIVCHWDIEDEHPLIRKCVLRAIKLNNI